MFFSNRILHALLECFKKARHAIKYSVPPPRIEKFLPDRKFFDATIFTARVTLHDPIHTGCKYAELYKAVGLKSDVRCTEIGNEIENIAYLAQRGTINIVSAPLSITDLFQDIYCLFRMRLIRSIRTTGDK